MVAGDLTAAGYREEFEYARQRLARIEAREVVWDAGDALEILRSVGVDIVLGGHRHVPYVWPVGELFLVHSGTASTHRVRGYAHPSYNFVTLTGDLLEVEVREPGGKRELLARYPRPSGPIGEHRDPIVRRQRGGSFRGEAS